MEQYIQNEKEVRTWGKRVIYLLVLVLVFGIGIFVGSYHSVQEYVSDDAGNVEIAKVLDLYGKTRSPDISFEQFWNVWELVKTKHVEQPVKEVDLFYSAIKGLVNGLDDPYSTYFPPVEAQEFAKDLAGEFEGIGAEIGIRNEQLIIVAPLPGSPAEVAGLRAGDSIFAIDGKDTSAMTLDEAVFAIRGEKGTKVVLTISHNGYDAIEDLPVIRDTITIPTVVWEMKEDNIAYVRLSYFNESTWGDFDNTVKEILLQNPEGVVLDLRMNPGGFLQTSVDVVSEWIEQGVIVSERFANEKENIHRSRGKHRLAGLPTVVLVDEGTASGSEIVAGALQDHALGTIVGTKTFGKGSVQDFEILSDGSALKLTIAKWFTPNGRAIDGEGIIPDVIVEDMFVFPAEGDDNASIQDMGLEKAIELLQQ